MNEMQASRICYLEIPAPFMDKAITFYTKVFGWQVETSDLSDDPYAMFSTGENGLAGGFDSRKQPVEAGVLIYLGVKDIQAKAKEAIAAGARLVQTRTPVGGDYGFFAIIEDPNGNRIGLWEHSTT